MTVKMRATSLARVEDAEWLLDTGEHPANVADRLGVSASTLYQTFRRAGKYRLDLDTEARYQEQQKRDTK